MEREKGQKGSYYAGEAGLIGKWAIISGTSFFFFWGGGCRDRVFLYSPGCPGAHSVDQAGLELRNPPASASRVLGLQACATNAWLAKREFEKKKNSQVW